MHGTRVLVTGADGFIGSHLVERLAELGADVTAFCVYNSNESYGWLDGCERPNVRRIVGDIRDAECVQRACEGIDVVFHLAALIAIPYSYQAPRSFVDTNVTGTLNVLEAVRYNNCRRLVQVSTSEVYGTPATIPICETHPLHPQSPYAASKVAADALCVAYHASYGTPVTILRPFNTYGPRQSTRAVLPAILTQLLAGQRQVKLGNVSTQRDLTYVSDTVEGIIRAGTDGPLGDVVQLGTGMAWRIDQLFTHACYVLGVEAEIVRDETRMRPDASEVRCLVSDPSKALAYLEWEPTVGLDDGIRRTAAWLRGER